MYLIIDTETTGLPKTKGYNKYYHYSENDKYDSSRMVQIAWKIFNKNLDCIKTKNYIIKRDNFSIENSKFHGITNSISETQGENLEFIFYDLFKDILNCKLIIGHNIDFDSNIILNHSYRVNNINFIIKWNLIEKFCTMKKSKNILKINSKFGYKYPNLSETYKYFYKKDFENPHNALFDVEACSKCFEYLKTNHYKSI